MKSFTYAFQDDNAYEITIVARHQKASETMLGKLVLSPEEWKVQK